MIKIKKNSVRLVIDIQQQDFIGMPDNEAEAAKFRLCCFL